MTAIVRPGGECDVEQSWRHRTLLAAGARDESQCVSWLDRDVREPGSVRRVPGVARRSPDDTWLTAKRRHLVDSRRRLAACGKDDPRAVGRKRRLGAVSQP